MNLGDSCSTVVCAVIIMGVFVLQKVGVRKKREAPGAEAGGHQKRTLQRKRSIKAGKRFSAPFSQWNTIF